MADTTSGKVSIGQLILWPALITLAITILRVVGELKGWPKPWFSAAGGGGAAIVGITWLPLILGPYFALKLARSGEGMASTGKALGLTLAALVVMVLGGAIVGKTLAHPGFLTILGFLILLAAAFIPGIGWRSLGNTLLAYGFAARIPVLIVMFFAMRGGWGTHYDAVEGPFLSAPLWSKFFWLAFMPQMFLWIGYTVVAGSLFGEIAAAIFARKPAAQAA